MGVEKERIYKGKIIIKNGGEHMEIEGVQVNGSFDAQRFFDTLAAILSRKYGVTITVKVSRKEDEDERLEQEKQVV